MKCFAVGMSSEFIRKDFQYKKPRIAVKFNSKPIVQFETSHQACNDEILKRLACSVNSRQIGVDFLKIKHVRNLLCELQVLSD